MKDIWEKFLFQIILTIFTVMGLVSRRTSVKISVLLGKVWFVIDKRHRNVAISNLTLAFGSEMNQAKIKQLARRVFCCIAQIIFDIGLMVRLSDSEFSKFFRIYGLHYLESAYKKGKGVLMLTGHFGSWELLTVATAKLGYPMSAIYRPLDFKPLDRFFIELRSRYGAKLYPKKNAMRPILRGLKSGELVGILLDQVAHPNAGVYVDFFGKPACTNKGLALIALRTEAPVLPVFLLREAKGYRVEFGPEVPVIRTGDKEKDIELNTRQYNRVLESFIVRYPEQWFWVHNRWKKR